MALLGEFQIFRAGTYVTAQGIASITQSEMLASQRAYDPALFAAPLVEGHPHYSEIGTVPQYGKVLSLFAFGNDLEALAEVEPPLVEAVNSGRLINRSASFFKPGDPNNPVPGVYYLNHVGFLGVGQPPAVENMPLLAFGAPSLVQFNAPRASNPLLADAMRRRQEAGQTPPWEVFQGVSDNPLIRDAEMRARQANRL